MSTDSSSARREPPSQIRAQRLDLAPWRPGSTWPPIARDLSIVIDRGEDDETIGDTIRAAVYDRIDDLESVAVTARTAYDALPPSARARLGLTSDQENALVRVVLRPLGRTLTDREANELRDRIYLAVHRGPHLELISG